MGQKVAHIATEQRSFDDVLKHHELNVNWVKAVCERLQNIADLASDARVLEIGAAAGTNLVALTEMGYQCEGIEPWEEARHNAAKLSQHLDMPLHIVDGRAEAIPYEAEMFDAVLAFAVMEHVLEIETALAEISRVLKPGGIFWFSTASSMSPLQHEITGFPLFGWYPDALKRRIMYWARDHKPHLIGHTETPAIHWFTPWKAKRLLHQAGFTTMYDRWDMRQAAATAGREKQVLDVICSTGLTKFIADIVVPGCSYAGVKG